jgi:hypothetical protein
MAQQAVVMYLTPRLFCVAEAAGANNIAHNAIATLEDTKGKTSRELPRHSAGSIEAFPSLDRRPLGTRNHMNMTSLPFVPCSGRTILRVYSRLVND